MSETVDFTKYERRYSNEEEDVGFLSASISHSRQKSCVDREGMRIVWIVAFGFFMTSYVFLGVSFFSTTRPSKCLRGNENIYDDAPIDYHKVTFQRSGFHDVKHNFLTVYEGRPNAYNDEAWDRLMSVGIATLSEEENRRLSDANGTVMSRREPGRYVVEIEMFHQLHCLKALRRQLWEFEEGLSMTGDPVERRQHFDHCIDYLRQAIMCHGDLTPTTFEWSTEINSYIAHHTTEHECRNFEKIFNWADNRKAINMAVDGDHKNVLLTKPTESD